MPLVAMARSTGQLDMGKPVLFLKQLQFFFQLQHTLPSFQSGRTGHSAQQCPLIDGFACWRRGFFHEQQDFATRHHSLNFQTIQRLHAK